MCHNSVFTNFVILILERYLYSASCCGRDFVSLASGFHFNESQNSAECIKEETSRLKFYKEKIIYIVVSRTILFGVLE